MFVAQINRQLDILGRWKFKMLSRFQNEPPEPHVLYKRGGPRVLNLTKRIPV